MAEKIEVLDSSFYKVKRSNTGLGLFALKDIKKGEWIIEYLGHILSNDQVEGLTTKYLFEIDDTITIDGSPRWNKARYINHSCLGNAESDIVEKKVYIKARKSIKAGQEITYDYGKAYFDEFIKPYGCLCTKCEKKSIKK
jgi:SET domain-containing protein